MFRDFFRWLVYDEEEVKRQRKSQLDNLIRRQTLRRKALEKLKRDTPEVAFLEDLAVNLTPNHVIYVPQGCYDKLKDYTEKLHEIYSRDHGDFVEYPSRGQLYVYDTLVLTYEGTKVRVVYNKRLTS